MVEGAIKAERRETVHIKMGAFDFFKYYGRRMAQATTVVHKPFLSPSAD
jgi:hypothetical protein